MAYKNILVIGRTGAGKSSLINYLAGQRLAEVGIGHPTTSRDDITSYATTFMGVSIRFFDSWGIETDKTEDWKRRIVKIVSDNGEVANECSSWFHTVVYCISAATSRVEPIDVQMIEYFLQQSFSVVVVLTNADRVSEEDMDAMSDALVADVDVVRISSGGRSRYGAAEPFGKEQLLVSIVRTALKNLPQRAEKHFKADVEHWRQDMIYRLGNKEVSRISNGDIERWIKKSANDYAKKLYESFTAFVAEEVRSVVVWGRNVPPTMPDYDICITAEVERVLSGWDYLGMTVFSPLLVVVGLGLLMFGSVEDERRKLREKIDMVARQMNTYIDKAVDIFRQRLESVR